MSQTPRKLSSCDLAITRIDAILRSATRTDLSQHRDYPADAIANCRINAVEERHAAGLMRVNHSGEVCAQALYLGQALFARNRETHSNLVQAAREEGDHLFWCEQRLAELGARPSRLNRAWFGGACVLGMLAAAAGDRWSLGFVEETERQVVEHLEGHLEALPPDDLRSRAVVAAMCDDEARHGGEAAAQGARSLPAWVRAVMALQARVMTKLAYWV